MEQRHACANRSWPARSPLRSLLHSPAISLDIDIFNFASGQTDITEEQHLQRYHTYFQTLITLSAYDRWYMLNSTIDVDRQEGLIALLGPYNPVKIEQC
jgi:hypothetical protein